MMNISLHNERMNRSRKELLSADNYIKIEECIRIPDELDNGIYKLRVIYSKEIVSFEFILYERKPVNKLKLVFDNEIEYKYKYLNRDSLNHLRSLRDTADEIIIVKNGFITDTSYSNLIFRKNDEWFTPTTYLLNGTQRQKLLQDGLVKEAEIKPEDFKYYSSVKLINSMIGFNESPEIPVANIVLY